MNDDRFRDALRAVERETVAHRFPRSSNVIFTMQTADDTFTLPRIRGFETQSFLLGDTSTARVDTQKGSVISSGAVQVLSLLFRRSWYRKRAITMASSESGLFLSATNSPNPDHLPDWSEQKIGDNEVFWDILRLITVVYAERKRDWEVLVETLVLALLSEKNRADDTQTYTQHTDKPADLIFQEIVSHPESVDLAALAKRYSYNTSYLSNLLRTQYGKTFTQLVREQRMARAQTLLRTTTLPIRKVAHMVGYTGTSSFYRYYEDQFGHSPKSERSDTTS